MMAEACFQETLDPAAVDVERFEDPQDVFHGQVFVDGPDQDIQVLLAPLEPLQDLLEEGGRGEDPLEESEVVVVQFDPEGAALDVFEPAVAEEDVPVLADPAADGPLAEV